MPVDLLDEQNVERRHVGMARNMIFAEIVINELAVTLVEHGILHQRIADPPDHPADRLAARELCVEDAARLEHAEHPPHPHFAGDDINRDFGELRAVRGLAESLGVRSLRNLAFADQGLGPDQIAQRHAAVARDRMAVLERHILRLRLHPLGQHRDDILARQRHRRAGTCRAERSTRPRTRRQIGIAEHDVDALHRQAQRFACNLREDGVGAGADVGHVGFDQSAAIGLERHARLRIDQQIDPHGGGDAHADQPFALTLLPRNGRTLGPAERFGALIEAFDQRARREGRAG